MKIQKSPTGYDFSVIALQAAIQALNVPHCDHYIIQVHQENIHWACKVVMEMNSATGYQSKAPRFSIEITPVGSRDSWAVWAYDNCYWSEGA